MKRKIRSKLDGKRKIRSGMKRNQNIRSEMKDLEAKNIKFKFRNEAQRNIFYVLGAKESINDFGFLLEKEAKRDRFATFRFEAKEIFFYAKPAHPRWSGGGDRGQGQCILHIRTDSLYVFFLI
jgi:hypothetical protein